MYSGYRNFSFKRSKHQPQRNTIWRFHFHTAASYMFESPLHRRLDFQWVHYVCCGVPVPQVISDRQDAVEFFIARPATAKQLRPVVRSRAVSVARRRPVAVAPPLSSVASAETAPCAAGGAQLRRVKDVPRVLQRLRNTMNPARLKDFATLLTRRPPDPLFQSAVKTN